VRYKLAILKVLANQPGGRATRDEVRRQAGLMIAELDQIELKRFTALGNIDIFHRGLVSRDDAGLQITDEGMALLDWLRSAAEPSWGDRSVPAAADVFRSGDEPLKGFHPEPNSPDTVDGWAASSPQDPQRRLASDVPHVKTPIRAVDPNRTRHFGIGQRVRQLFRSVGAFFSRVQQSIRNSGRSRTARSSSMMPLVRSERSIRTIAGAAFGLVVLLLVVGSVLAAIAFGQIQSLKSDVAVLRRELLPLREGLAKFERAENQKREDQAEEPEEPQNTSTPGKNKPGGELDEPTKFELTSEEIQLIRQYIKPAPSWGEAAPEIKVGDPVGGAMIPLPSALMEKIPKLQGAKFTTLGGSIVIVRNGSRQADTVLGPN
jgi:hypothetical protein